MDPPHRDVGMNTYPADSQYADACISPSVSERRGRSRGSLQSREKKTQTGQPHRCTSASTYYLEASSDRYSFLLSDKRRGGSHDEDRAGSLRCLYTTCVRGQKLDPSQSRALEPKEESRESRDLSLQIYLSLRIPGLCFDIEAFCTGMTTAMRAETF